MSKIIRYPAVAGQFYPNNKQELTSDVEKYLNSASYKEFKNIRSLIVPHAGYVFSGKVAASSYKLIQNRSYKTIFLVSNSHQEYFSGIAIDSSDVWQTPLGEIELDKDTIKILLSKYDFKYDDKSHKRDHVLEVQLPFLQKTINEGFKIVPILFGQNSNTHIELTKILKEIMTADDLLIISSDMSHYPEYGEANNVDKKTLDIIKQKNIEKLDSHINDVMNSETKGEETMLCGIDGVKTIMNLASDMNWDSEVINYANSGDSSYGSKDRVVGYGSIVFYEEDEKVEIKREGKIEIKNILNFKQKEVLLNIAKTTIETYVNEGKIPIFNVQDKRLEWKEGAFVTIKKKGRLRGCIGQIVPSEDPLYAVVRDMAIAAATMDPRFEPVSRKELEGLEYEVSVLSSPTRVDDWHKIELGRHGVIVKKGIRSGIFLPQVAKETDWNLEEFLGQLCSQKAGLNQSCYKNDPEVELEIFTAQVFE